MSESTSDRRLAENEVIFRQLNGQVQRALEEMKRVAGEEGQEFLIKDHDEKLHFYCECSDEKCRQRIIMKPSVYDKIHSHVNRFVILPGHDVERIEHVVVSEPNYWVVEKYEKPPQRTGSLNPSNIKNN